MWYVIVKCFETVFTVCVSDVTMGCCVMGVYGFCEVYWLAVH